MTPIEWSLFLFGSGSLFLGGAWLKPHASDCSGLPRFFPAIACLMGVVLTGGASAHLWMVAIATLTDLLDGLSAIILTTFVYALIVMAMALSGYTARSRWVATDMCDDGQRV